MSFKKSFIRFNKILNTFLLHPRQAIDFLDRLPEVVRGSAYCQAEGMILDRQFQRAGPEDRSSDSLPNPLRQYFDSRKNGRGIWKWDHYFDIYHRYLNKFIGKEVHIVEVGIYSGGSLEMWKNYFGPGCHVYGVDIQEACRLYEEERTKIFIGDQADREFWKRFRQQVPNVDILIDDGGHLPEQQIVTLEEMLPHIRPGGVYICEDIGKIGNSFSVFVHQLADCLNAVNAVGATVKTTNWQRSIQSVHLYPYIVVIQKNDNPINELSNVKRGTQWQPFLNGII